MKKNKKLKLKLLNIQIKSILSKLKNFLLCLFYFIFFLGNAQIGFTEKQIIAEQGKYFEREVNENTILLYYKSKVLDDLGNSIQEIIL